MAKTATPASDSGSFRDREGRVYLHRGRVLRGLSESALGHFRQLERTGFYRRGVSDGRIIGTRLLPAQDNPMPAGLRDSWAGYLEHERVGVISYPYEWPFTLLKSAALLQLELLAEALEEDFIIKDATPYNVQFVDGRAVFIDIPSFEPWTQGTPWAGYRQFCELFLFPLMLQAYRGIDFQPFLRARIDGVEVGTADRLLGGKWYRRGVFSHVRLQAMLHRRYAGRRRGVASELRAAGFSKAIICANVRKLRRLVDGLEWTDVVTEWADYASFHNYSEADHRRKEAFVRDAVEATRPGTTWDLGANTGQFAAIAAQSGGQVLALDVDHQAVERMALDPERPPKVLPLVQNLLDPSPDWGWRRAERRHLGARSQPDLLLCLALVHHVVISGNVPLEDFVAWLARLAPHLVIEYVAREDDKVAALLQNKVDIYHDYRRANFEAQLARWYEVVAASDLSSGRRVLYRCVRKDTARPEPGQSADPSPPG